MKRMIGVGVLVLSAGCTVPQPYQTPAPAPSTTEPEPTVQTQPGSPPSTVETPQPLPEPVNREPVLSAASRALVSQAQAQVTAKNYSVAAGSIERALRIEPDNPLLWVELARVRQAEGNYVQSENVARKAVSMSVQAPSTQAQAWELIAESYRARGKNLEARQADAKADALLHRQ
jgi:predicted Zn-dependent protease